MAVKYEKAASCQTLETTSALASHTHLVADVGVSHAITEMANVEVSYAQYIQTSKGLLAPSIRY